MISPEQTEIIHMGSEAIAKLSNGKLFHLNSWYHYGSLKVKLMNFKDANDTDFDIAVSSAIGHLDERNNPRYPNRCIINCRICNSYITTQNYHYNFFQRSTISAGIDIPFQYPEKCWFLDCTILRARIDFDNFKLTNSTAILCYLTGNGDVMIEGIFCDCTTRYLPSEKRINRRYTGLFRDVHVFAPPKFVSVYQDIMIFTWE